MAVAGDFYTFMVLDVSAGVPSLAYGATGPSVGSLKCNKPGTVL